MLSKLTKTDKLLIVIGFVVIITLVTTFGQCYMHYKQVLAAQQIDVDDVLPEGAHLHADGRLHLPTGEIYESYDAAVEAILSEQGYFVK